MQGFLLINKPSGITSFGVCAKIRRITGEKRIGHTGTLDPMATGVLPVFVGRPTVLSSFLLEADKRYIATVRLGVATDTDDITGNIIKTAEPVHDMRKIYETVNSFLGSRQQFPPAFSAIKKDGVALYKLARNGENVKTDPRNINIFGINILNDIDINNEFKIDVTCSKGTYIRSLCRDIGEKLGCFATMSALERVKTGAFEISECVDLDVLDEDNILDYLKPAEYALPHLNSVSVTEKQAVRFSNGGGLYLERIKAEFCSDGEILKVNYNDAFLGLGQVSFEKEQLLVKCVIEQYTAV